MSLNLTIVFSIVLRVEDGLDVERYAADSRVFLVYYTWLLAFGAEARARVSVQKRLRRHRLDFFGGQGEVAPVFGALPARVGGAAFLLVETGLIGLVGARTAQKVWMNFSLERARRSIQRRIMRTLAGCLQLILILVLIL